VACNGVDEVADQSMSVSETLSGGPMLVTTPDTDPSPGTDWSYANGKQNNGERGYVVRACVDELCELEQSYSPCSSTQMNWEMNRMMKTMKHRTHISRTPCR